VGKKERGCAKGCRVGIRKVKRRAVMWGKKKGVVWRDYHHIFSLGFIARGEEGD
jgi:hypothetical protein